MRSGEAYSAPPDLIAVFRGPVSQGRGKGEGEEQGREAEAEGVGVGKGREGENDLTHPLSQILGYATAGSNMPHDFAGYNKDLPVISGISVYDGYSQSVNYSYIDTSLNSRLSLFSPGQNASKLLIVLLLTLLTFFRLLFN